MSSKCSPQLRHCIEKSKSLDLSLSPLQTDDSSSSDVMNDISSLSCLSALQTPEQSNQDLLSEVDLAIVQLKLWNQSRHAMNNPMDSTMGIIQTESDISPVSPETEIELPEDITQKGYCNYHHGDDAAMSSLRELMNSKHDESYDDIDNRIAESQAKILVMQPGHGLSILADQHHLELRSRELQILQESLLLEMHMENLASNLNRYANDLEELQRRIDEGNADKD